MIQAGLYNPENEVNPSTLWEYGEMPVTSDKLNNWNGNIAAGFWMMQQALRALVDDNSTVCLLGQQGETPLLVEATTPASLTLRVHPGLVVGNNYLAGISEEIRLPASGNWNLPTTAPRIDRVVIDSSGAVGVLAGIENAIPAPPLVPAGSVLLAEVLLRPGSVRIQAVDDFVQSVVSDARPKHVPICGHTHTALEQPIEAPDGIRVAFSTVNCFVAGSLRVHLNGAICYPIMHYNEQTGRKGYTFINPPGAGSVLVHDYIRASHS